MTGSKQFGFGRLFRFSGVMLSAWLLSASAPVHAQASGNAGFDTYVQSLWPKAQAKGVSRATFDRDRKSVVEGKSVSVRVDLGGRRLIKKKKKTIKHSRKHTYPGSNVHTKEHHTRRDH